MLNEIIIKRTIYNSEITREQVEKLFRKLINQKIKDGIIEDEKNWLEVLP